MQQPNESAKAYADRFLQAAARAGRQEDDALLYQFVRRLRPSMCTEVARQRLHSIEDVVSFCIYWSGLHDTSDKENAFRDDSVHELAGPPHRFQHQEMAALAPMAVLTMTVEEA